jgi:hypothetical protein
MYRWSLPTLLQHLSRVAMRHIHDLSNPKRRACLMKRQYPRWDLHNRVERRLSSLTVNSMLAPDVRDGPRAPGTLGPAIGTTPTAATLSFERHFALSFGPGIPGFDACPSRVSRAFAESFVSGLGVGSTPR